MNRILQHTTLARTAVWLFMAFCLVSCSKQADTAYDADREPIRFFVNMERTKTVVSDGCLPDSYTIYASAYSTNTTDPANSGDYFLSRPFRSDAGVWKSDPAVYWPLGCRLDFLAVACEDESFDLSEKLVWNGRNCTYGVEVSVGDGECLDSELLYASAFDRTSGGGGVSLLFNHAQSRLQFVVNSEAAEVVRIDSIIVKDVFAGGTLNVSNGIRMDAAWSFGGHRHADLTVPGSEGVVIGEGSSPVCDILLPEQKSCDILLHYSIRFSTEDDWSEADNRVYRYEAKGDPWYYGKKNIFYIKVELSEVMMTSSVMEWDEETVGFDIEDEE